MIELTRQDVRELVEFMEFFIENESIITIDDLMKKYDITFDEYRILSALCMPAIRRNNERKNILANTNYYKGAKKKLEEKLKEAEKALILAQKYVNAENPQDLMLYDQAMAAAKEFLDGYFKKEEPPVVKKPEDEENLEIATNENVSEAS